MNAAERREHARRLVADWPPLTPEQRIRLAVLLRPNADVRPGDHPTTPTDHPVRP
jgi:hypothetical protein